MKRVYRQTDTNSRTRNSCQLHITTAGAGSPKVLGVGVGLPLNPRTSNEPKFISRVYTPFAIKYPPRTGHMPCSNDTELFLNLRSAKKMMGKFFVLLC